MRDEHSEDFESFTGEQNADFIFDELNQVAIEMGKKREAFNLKKEATLSEVLNQNKTDTLSKH